MCHRLDSVRWLQGAQNPRLGSAYVLSWGHYSQEFVRASAVTRGQFSHLHAYGCMRMALASASQLGIP